MAIIYIDSRSKNLPDSGAWQIHKFGTAAGEQRIALEGSWVTDKNLFDFYLKDVEFYFFTKSDLLDYISSIQEEINFPTQKYTYKEYPKFYENKKSEIIDYPLDFITLHFEANPRAGGTAYLSSVSEEDSNIYNFFRSICLSSAKQGKNNAYTTYRFIKYQDTKSGKFYINLVPTFSKKYTMKELSNILQRALQNANDIHVALNLFGLKYAVQIIEGNYNCQDLINEAGADADLIPELEVAIEVYKKLKNDQVTINPVSNKESLIGAYIEQINTNENLPTFLFDEPLQKISYGAPGTGKSNGIKQFFIDNNINEKEYVFRTTFHPDSDYSTFVGTYKPTMQLRAIRDSFGQKVKDSNGNPVYEDKIVYSFVPQAFTNAYVKAYNSQDKPVFLVIEEINRGNCAQIFGDLFQLLDRKNGFSEYPIKASEDLRDYLLHAKDENGKEILVNKDGIKNGQLCLPNNLYIWATMNTSDQSLFPIDSAFKRRWDWEYMPINYANGNWEIEIGKIRYSWVSFQKIVNKKVYDINHSEDKMLGDFFVKANDQDVISEKVLINKILFYLWNDVCKDGEGDIFKKDEKTDLTFSDLYGSNGTTNLIAMMDYLGVEQIEDDDMDENDETNSDTQGGTKKHPKYSINGSTKVYSTPESVLKIINDFAQKNLNMSVPDMIKTWNRITNRNDFLIESWEPSPTDNSNPKRRTAIKWNGKSVWVNRGWTEELFQTFIENVKKELGYEIVKVN